MSFYHNILEMMQHPLQEYRFPGIEVPVVPKDSLRSPSEWVGFMSRSFVPFCTFYFSKDQLWKWQTWKLEMGQQGAIYGVDNKNVHFPEAVVVPHVPSVPVVPQGVPKGGAKAVKPPKQSLCLVDAFTALGIVDKLPKNITSKCRGSACVFRHVSDASQGDMSHKNVYKRLISVVPKGGAKAVAAFTAAMDGVGRTRFKAPFYDK